MLTITVGQDEFFDETADEFLLDGGTVVQLEHSLASLSKWESIHEKPFLTDAEKTSEEILSYVSCMVLSPEASPELLQKFTPEDLTKINSYINSKQTATTFAELKTRSSREIVTAEVIYYWMVSFQIPFECQYWHLNKLLTLVRVCNEKNKPPKKMRKSEMISQRRALNEQRRMQLGTSG